MAIKIKFGENDEIDITQYLPKTTDGIVINSERDRRRIIDKHFPDKKTQYRKQQNARIAQMKKLDKLIKR